MVVEAVEALRGIAVSALIEALRGAPHPFLLETGSVALDPDGPDQGPDPWHYLGAHPVREWKWFPDDGDPWEALDQLLASMATESRSSQDQVARAESDNSALPPFRGGAVGYIAYEAGARAYSLGGRSRVHPDLHFHLYDEVLALNARTGAALWLHRGREGAESRRWWTAQSVGQRRDSLVEPLPLRLQEQAPSIGNADYLQGVQALRDGIGRGDYYEVNFCRRHTARLREPGEVDVVDLYQRLRTRQPVPYSALLPWSPVAVVSASPECFLSKRGKRVVTRPIKGTARRVGEAQLDARAQHELLNSAKERAELSMIIDLQRNDLGRVAEGGSVRVVEEAALEEYSTVFHTVATIDAVLRPEVCIGELLGATFPGGSITGAPKLAAMHAIEQWERAPRHLYTGSIGWIGANGDLELSIAIRTVLVDDDGIHYSVGGAITWDSEAESELRELAAKGEAIRQALGLEREL